VSTWNKVREKVAARLAAIIANPKSTPSNVVQASELLKAYLPAEPKDVRDDDSSLQKLTELIDGYRRAREEEEATWPKCEKCGTPLDPGKQPMLDHARAVGEPIATQPKPDIDKKAQETTPRTTAASEAHRAAGEGCHRKQCTSHASSALPPSQQWQQR
jgi:hypothetical protein